MPRPFDERAVLCDNRWPVPQLPRAVLFTALALAALAAPACDKPNDLPRMQDEVSASVVDHRARFDALKRRAEAVDLRTRALPQDMAAAAALHTLGLARTAIDQDLAHLQQMPTMLSAWMSSSEARKLVRTWLDDRRRGLDDDLVEATAELEAVESWTAIAEQRAGSARPGAAAEPQEPQEPPPAPPATDDRPPPTDRTGAPIR